MQHDYQPIDPVRPKRRVNRVAYATGILVLGLLAMFLFYRAHPEPPAHPSKRHLNEHSVHFGNVRNNTFKPVFKPLQWISDPNSYADDKGLFVTDANNTYVIKSVHNTNYHKVLYDGKTFEFDNEIFNIDSFVASPDLTKVLIRTNTTQNWRHSTFGFYWVLDTATKNIDLIGEGIALAQWSPNSKQVAYVLDNDIYIYEKDTKTIRVTHDGSQQMFNGKPDWVYEEEVLEGDSAMWWSPNGSYLTFYKIDETLVREFPIPYFVQDDEPYPELRNIKYPKPGTPNPVVKLAVYDLAMKHTSVVNTDDRDELLFTEVVWVGQKDILVKVSDRSSDELQVLLVDAPTGNFEVTRRQPADGGWWEISHNAFYVPKDESNGRIHDGYIDTMPIDGYNHLVYFSPASATEPVVLTKGKWEVVAAPTSFNYKTNDVYYISTEKSSMERHLYVVNLHKPREISALTDVSKDGMFSASFSSGGRFALLTYAGPHVPYQKLVDFESTKQDKHVKGNIFGHTLFYLEENKELQKAIKKYAIPITTYRELSLGHDEYGDEIRVNSYEIHPYNFDSKVKDHYPVFFFAYGGPNSQQVTKTFNVGFNHVVAAQLGAIVVVVDGRGTGFKGKKFRSVVRDNLSFYEAQDQIAAAKMYGEMKHVNAEKISLFGWSYGGYLTLKTLEADAGKHFKYGMSVAPVTDWRLYDSIYTERYMHTPQQNPEGYEITKVHNMTALGEAQRFLLMHGTGDDNVHIQHSMKLLDKLNLAGVENYDVHFFPDSDHAIRFHNASNIIYDKLFKWVGKAFNGDFVKSVY